MKYIITVRTKEGLQFSRQVEDSFGGTWGIVGALQEYLKDPIQTGVPQDQLLIAEAPLL